MEFISLISQLKVKLWTLIFVKVTITTTNYYKDT